MDYEKWYCKAVTNIQSNISVNETFELKKLFMGIEWDTLSSGDKKSFGRFFSSKVKDGQLPCVERCGEGKSHHNKYVKVSDKL